MHDNEKMVIHYFSKYDFNFFKHYDSEWYSIHLSILGEKLESATLSHNIFTPTIFIATNKTTNKQVVTLLNSTRVGNYGLS